MANSFSKEERVAFEQLLQDFEDALVLSRNVAVYKTDQTMMERTGNVIWRPQPYISVSYSGTDMTANFLAQTQMSVPATIGFQRSVPWSMNATELRDALQAQRLGASAKQKLASDINLAVLTAATQLGTLVYSSSSAASGFADVANIEAIMNRVGIQYEDRYLALSTTDYNGLAKDLANRQNMVDMTKEAYKRGYVGMVASFETYKMDYSLRCGVAAGSGITMSTLASASNYYVPQATVTSSTGQRSNVDNRFQTITVSSTTGVAIGDAFTIAGVDEAHHVTKQDTGSLKSFRVVTVLNSTQLVITPPIISNQGGSISEQQYQNTVVSTSASAALVFLNLAAAYINPFWFKDAIEILPGRYEIPMDAGAAVMRATTEQGIDLVLQKQYDINTMLTKYRLDTLYGVNVLQPEMCGIALFSQ
jgi:hypothetical protein